MKIDIVSVFPEYFEVMNLSLMGKAQAKGLLEIKAHNLQDPQDKRTIVADDKLRPVLGKDRAGMFELTGLIGPHLVANA